MLYPRSEYLTDGKLIDTHGGKDAESFDEEKYQEEDCVTCQKRRRQNCEESRCQKGGSQKGRSQKGSSQKGSSQEGCGPRCGAEKGDDAD